MSDIKLDYTGQSGDIALEQNQIVLAFGKDAIEQQLRIRLRFFFEEWFLDQRVGIPYYREILIKNPNLQLVRSIYKEAIESTPGIDSADSLQLSIDGATRTLSLYFTATMDTGQTLEFSPFIIEL